MAQRVSVLAVHPNGGAQSLLHVQTHGRGGAAPQDATPIWGPEVAVHREKGTRTPHY